ncbi:hypothetical protein Tco_0243928 [Tanacetum coccineum]
MYDPLSLEIWSITFPFGLQIQHAEDLTVLIPCLAIFTNGLGAAVSIGLAALAGAAALEELYLAALIGTMPDLVKIIVGAKSHLELEKF